MPLIETERLTLRELTSADAAFILRLVNEPAWLQYIGDRGVHNLADAENYILKGPMASYEQNGFGLWLTALTALSTPLGICGLIKRPALEDVDIGFAFMPEFWGHGYAYEAAAGVLAYGQNTLDLKRIVAIVDPVNDRSIKLLEKLGMRFEQMVRLSDDDIDLKYLLNNPG